MSFQGVQALISKLFADKELKSRFLSDPEQVLKEFGLGEEEKKAVLQVHRRIGLATDLGELRDNPEPLAWIP